MQKEKLVLLPLCAGLILMLYSWYLSYPLRIDSVNDFVFNHISPLYWLSLASMLASLYVIATMNKSSNLKLIICASIVMSFYGLSYFYYSLPGSDVHYFRGLTEYFIRTDDLDPSKPAHTYFQWPIFFIFNKMAVSITGLEAIHFEFLLYAILGLLYVASFYVYASKFSKDGGYLAVAAYFIVMYMFLNYQFAPFSLAFGFIFLLYILDTHTTAKPEVTLTTMLIFTILTLLHPYAPAFFVIYELIMYIMSRRQRYLRLFVFTLVTYLVVLIYFTTTFFPYVVREVTNLYTGEYPTIIGRTFSERVAAAPIIEPIAQTFSRTIIISTAAISFLGFLLLWRRRKLRPVDYAIFLSGALYSVAGAILPVLGNRAFYFLFIPISLGVTYFLTSKFRKPLICIFLALLILFAFIPLHRSFQDAQIMFQTEEEYVSANFMLDHYNWDKSTSVLSHFRLMHYLEMRSAGNVSFGHDLDESFPDKVSGYDSIVYTVGLGKSFMRHNSSMSERFSETAYNRVFDSSFTYIAIKNNSSYGKKG